MGTLWLYMDESELLRGMKADEHHGGWVVIIDDEIVGKGPDLKELLEKARKEHPGKEPFVTTLQTRKAMLI